MNDTPPERRIAFQGEPGAFSEMACRAMRPELTPLPCPAFEDMLTAVQEGRAGFAMVPVENSLAGRVADIHHLLPESGLHIIGEHFQPIRLNLLGLPGARIDDIKTVRSHGVALLQCRGLIREHGWTRVTAQDTAGSAREVKEAGDKTMAAISSALAAETHGLDILASDVEDAAHNTTRFLLMTRQGVIPALNGGKCVTTIVFRVRSVPAALYKALGGFATNGINLTKLESYMLGGSFEAAQFYVDAEGHPEDRAMRLALEELRFFCPKGAVRVLGVYPAHPYRLETAAGLEG